MALQKRESGNGRKKQMEQVEHKQGPPVPGVGEKETSKLIKDRIRGGVRLLVVPLEILFPPSLSTYECTYTTHVVCPHLKEHRDRKRAYYIHAYSLRNEGQMPFPSRAKSDLTDNS